MAMPLFYLIAAQCPSQR